MITLIRGSGNTRKAAPIAHRNTTLFREERERVVEDLKALVLRPATFKNFSNKLG